MAHLRLRAHPSVCSSSAHGIWHFPVSLQLSWGQQSELWQTEYWCGTSSRSRHLRTDVPFPSPFPSYGDLGDDVFRMAGKQDGEGPCIHIRLGGIKKSFSAKLLGCRDSLVTIEPKHFCSVQWDCLGIVTIVQTHTITDHDDVHSSSVCTVQQSHHTRAL